MPNGRAVHNLEHGAVWITHQPSLPWPEVNTLRAFAERQTVISPAGGTASRYLELTPYPGLPSPVVVSWWGFQLRLTSPSDPRLQELVSKFRASQTYTPEYGGRAPEVSARRWRSDTRAVKQPLVLPNVFRSAGEPAGGDCRDGCG